MEEQLETEVTNSGLADLSPGEPTVVYWLKGNLYINLTYACSNRCVFCFRYHGNWFRGSYLRLKGQGPSVEEIRNALGEEIKKKKPGDIVFCGLGESTYRLDAMKTISRLIRDNWNISIRLNTDGHGNMINKRDITGELSNILDSIVVSLDAHDERSYEEICRPIPGQGSFQEVIDFTKKILTKMDDVTLTVVEYPGIDPVKAEALAREIGVKFKSRPYIDPGKQAQYNEKNL